MPIRSNPSRASQCDRAPRVEHGLTIGLQRASDVGADDVVGALQFRRPARIVIRQAQPERGDPESREQLTQPDVPLRIGVPLREHDDGAPRLRRVLDARRKHADDDGVVDRRRRVERAREPQHAVAQLEVVSRRCREERVAVRQCRGGPLGDAGGRRGDRRQVEPIETPLERPDDPIGVDRRQAAFPGMEATGDHGSGVGLGQRDPRTAVPPGLRSRQEGPIRTSRDPARGRGDPARPRIRL